MMPVLVSSINFLPEEKDHTTTLLDSSTHVYDFDADIHSLELYTATKGDLLYKWQYKGQEQLHLMFTKQDQNLVLVSSVVPADANYPWRLVAFNYATRSVINTLKLQGRPEFVTFNRFTNSFMFIIQLSTPNKWRGKSDIQFAEWNLNSGLFSVQSAGQHLIDPDFDFSYKSSNEREYLLSTSGNSILSITY
jgi:hypothetical protein